MGNVVFWQIVLAVLSIGSAAGLIVGLLISSENQSRAYVWKVSLISLVLAVAGLLLVPPSRTLKPGLDLAGGTVLVYQVQVPDGASEQQVLEDIIEILKKRVDPNGVRNLIWQPQAGGRIEIQMAHASAETRKWRDAYLDAVTNLLDQNLDRREVEAVLASDDPQQRSSAIAQLAGDNEPLLGELTQAAQAYQRMQQFREPYQQTQQQLRAASQALENLPQEAPADQRQMLQDNVAELQKELIAKTKPFVEARQRYRRTVDRILEGNITTSELDAVLNTADSQVVLDDGSTTTRRQQAIDRLIQQHPGKQAAIEQVAAAWDEYEELKGPLDDPADLQNLLRGSGVLEFRIAPSTELPVAEQYRQQLQEQGPRGSADADYRWLVVDDISSFFDEAETRRELQRKPNESREAYVQRVQTIFGQRDFIAEPYGDEIYMLLSNLPGQRLTQAEPGWELTSAGATVDSSGFPAVSFNMNPVGAGLLGELTESHINEPMAIVLDGRVISAPNINSRISSSGIITKRGGYNQAELNYLRLTLAAGALPGKLSEEPIAVRTVDPQFGADNINAGMTAAIWALVLVALFMAGYYFFGGLVADFAVFSNMLIILGVMAMLDATFTLPGIAGMVLTIGMAVDANVLIFERIREELERGVDSKAAIRLGYQKALSTIVDANVTTLITCVILANTATAEIKGFAITLGIGILATLFTSLFCTRVIIELAWDKTRFNKLVMLPSIVPVIRRTLSPNIDWIGKRHAFFVVSAVLMIAGLTLVFYRGAELLDIEFRSGTQVQFTLDEGKTLEIAEVRDRLDQAAAEMDGLLSERIEQVQSDLAMLQQSQMPSPEEVASLQSRLTQLQRINPSNLRGDVARVQRVGEFTGTTGSAFSISTLIDDPDLISNVIKTQFTDVLSAEQPLRFVGSEAQTVSTAPVFPVRQASLGSNINQPQFTRDVSEFLGGIAIVLNELSPAVTADDLRQRIERLRLQPPYDQQGFPPMKVLGLELASDAQAQQGADELRYRSAVVLVRHEQVNYVQNPDAFDDRGGFADLEWQLVRDAMLRDTALGSVSSFSPQVSGTMKQSATVAMVLALIAVVIYIWFRFGSVRYGLAAIAALVHDVCIALGLVAIAGYLVDSGFGHAFLLTDFKIDLALVAAMLTIVGYSLNDTIVVFDRIRENRGRLADVTPGIINDSINQTISRTVLTSGTTFLALFTLYTLGGPGVHGFAFAMIIGVMIGTYSSVAIAAPILMLTRKLVSQEKAQATGEPVAAT